MYVRSLRIENLRCFKSAEVELQFPGREQESPPPLPNVNLLLGNNGVGKTTMLKAIALGVLAEILPGSGYVPYNLVRFDDFSSPILESSVLFMSPSPAFVEADLLLHPQDLGPEGAEVRQLRSRVQVHRMRTQEQLTVPLSEPKDLFFRQELYDEPGAGHRDRPGGAGVLKSQS